jgi:hypothetical protein
MAERAGLARRRMETCVRGVRRLLPPALLAARYLLCCALPLTLMVLYSLNVLLPQHFRAGKFACGCPALCPGLRNSRILGA